MEYVSIPKNSRAEVFWKKVFLKISEISTCNFIEKDCNTNVFLRFLRNFYKYLF